MGSEESIYKKQYLDRIWSLTGECRKYYSCPKLLFSSEPTTGPNLKNIAECTFIDRELRQGLFYTARRWCLGDDTQGAGATAA